MGPPEVVLKYLRDQNRPYSVNDIFMNLHKEIGKTAVQKALDHLVEKDHISEKTYGKQKVYVIKQEESFTGDSRQQLNDLDLEIKNISERLASFEEEFKNLEIQLRELQATPTTDEAKRELGALEERTDQLKERLGALSQTTVKISATEKESVKKSFDSTLKVWRKRKRVCMDILDSILEGYPKDKKTLLEEVGIETDESAGVSINC
ncbi:Homologous-pairing protein 2 [Blattella germanica]|nr:Homologous-pairing protein 2 [Blattella germanica]